MSSVLSLASRTARKLGVDTTAAYQRFSARSIQRALREQGLSDLCDRLREIVPDTSDQYSVGFERADFERYWEIKMRGLHAFQTSCALQAIDLLGRRDLTVVDLGDSSGNHAAYIRALAPEGTVRRVVSVNMDETAIRKIRDKGGEAIHARVEDLKFDGLAPDLMISFETLEHILNPVGFLHNLATSETARHFVLSVPYRRASRFGGNLIRRSMDELAVNITPEETHIFELSPDDWRLLARFAGYKPVFSRVYLQYPTRSILRLSAPIWRKLDFEGFLVLFLERDLTLSDRYTGW
jgi:SAM-dependent methyltransferase